MVKSRRAIWILLIIALFSLQAAAHSPPWWDLSYKYREQINATTGSDAPYKGYENYTVRVVLDTTGARSDGEDIRVVRWSGSSYSELDRLVAGSGTASTDIRFALSTDIASDSYDDTYYIYYGNPAAAGAPSDAGEVYLWFDDGSSDRESEYIQGIIDDTAHGGQFGDTLAHSANGYYTFDTGDNFADSFRPSGLTERDVYIEFDHYHINAYDNDMTSGPIMRWTGTGNGETEVSSHFYYYEIGYSSALSSGGYPSHDTITSADRANTIITHGQLGAYPTTTWNRLGIAAWGTNPTNLNAYFNNASGGWDGYRFTGTHTGTSDHENSGQAGFWLQQDAGRVDNLLIRRYTEPEPTLVSERREVLNIPYFTSTNHDAVISLTPATTETIWCNGTVMDDDGLTDIDTVQGHLLLNGTLPSDPLDRRNHYHDPDCDLTITLDGGFACSFDVYFFADPGAWACNIIVNDSHGYTNTSNLTTAVEELMAIRVDESILDFGLLEVGTDTGTTDHTHTIYNEGNVAFDILIDTFNTTIGDSTAMGCDIGSIPAENVRASLDAGRSIDTRTAAPALGTGFLDTNLTEQDLSEGTLPTSTSVHWGIIIPESIAGQCTGNVRYIAQKSS